MLFKLNQQFCIKFGAVAVQDLPTEGRGGPIPVLLAPSISQDANLDPVPVHLCQGEDGLIPDLQIGTDGTIQGLLLLVPGKRENHPTEGYTWCRSQICNLIFMPCCMRSMLELGYCYMYASTIVHVHCR